MSKDRILTINAVAHIERRSNGAKLDAQTLRDLDDWKTATIANERTRDIMNIAKKSKAALVIQTETHTEKCTHICISYA